MKQVGIAEQTVNIYRQITATDELDNEQEYD